MTKTEILTAQITAFLGKPYHWGGKTPIFGMDCSGLVIELLKSIGEEPNKEELSSGELKEHFQAISADNVTPQFGSLLFFGVSQENISHIAFALDDKFMVEAGGGDHTTVSAEIADKMGAYIKIRPIAHRQDLQAIHHLNLEE